MNDSMRSFAMLAGQEVCNLVALATRRVASALFSLSLDSFFKMHIRRPERSRFLPRYSCCFSGNKVARRPPPLAKWKKMSL